MSPRNLADLAEMVYAAQLRLCPSFRADGSIAWSLTSYRAHGYGLWPAYSIECGVRV